MKLSEIQLFKVLLVQEIRTLLISPALWMLLIILSFLVGYSFIQAVELFSQASRTAISYPELARGMNPLEGVFVPTFGAYYLIETLLLPFIIIRLIGQDKQNGTLKLLLQLPVSVFFLHTTKLSALVIVWLLVMLPGISVIVSWELLGGSIYLPQILTLFLGHALYTLVITCIAMLATVLCSNLSTAAIICLAVTLGSWVLDFSAHNGGWAEVLASISLTTLLRQFENGLLSSVSLIRFMALSLLFFIAASVLLHPGQSMRYKFTTVLTTMAVLVFIVSVAALQPRYIDVTESHKYSLNPADERALKQMTEVLKITVHLSREDGRLYDFEHGILGKLQRTMPNLKVVYVKTPSSGLFDAPEDGKYGLLEYEYAAEHAQSYSNNSREVLSLLYHMAGLKVVPDPVPDYKGHPLVADTCYIQWWFYLLLPLLFLSAAIWFRRQDKQELIL